MVGFSNVSDCETETMKKKMVDEDKLNSKHIIQERYSAYLCRSITWV